MTNALNQSILLVGFVGKEVTLTTMDNGQKIANLIFACFENEPTSNTKKLVWYRISAWNHLAQDLVVMVKKGDRLKVKAYKRPRQKVSAKGKVKSWEEIIMIDFINLSAGKAKHSISNVAEIF